jgi:hypothetical protein
MKNLFNLHWPFWISAALLAVMILTPLIGNHYFRNLEPYPDGLMYTVPPLELLESGNWQLEYNGMNIKPNVPPLYSILMLPLMLIWRSPDAFILLNFLLALGTLWFLYKSLKKYSKSDIRLAMILMIYGANSVVWWLGVLPMAENLGLFLTSMTIYLITSEYKKSPLILPMVAIAFILTKYIYYPVGLVIAAGLLLYLMINKRYKELAVSASILIAGLVLTVLFQVYQGSGPLLGYLPIGQTATENTLNLEATGQSFTFFSTKYIRENISFYINSLIGNKLPLLWIQISLLPFLFTIDSFWGFKKFQKENLPQFILIGFLWLSQYVMLLNFYVADQRYAILSLVFIVFFAGYHFLTLHLEPGKKTINYLIRSAVFLVVFSLIFKQDFNYLSIIKSNLFLRSQAWQYQAVREFEKQQVNFEPDSYLITALPPFLITAYTNPSYKIMPLSRHQEFLAKGQNVWNPEITDSQDLVGLYRQWLDQGRNLYISNAYITHQQSVINDFNMFKFKKYFEMELISEGCDQTCNIYKLTKQMIPDNQVEFDYENEAIRFVRANPPSEIKVRVDYSASDVFNFGQNYSKRYASSQKAASINNNDYELILFDFETLKSLKIDPKINLFLKNSDLDNVYNRVDHYWSPIENRLVIIANGFYTKGKVAELVLDEEAGQLNFVRELNFPNTKKIDSVKWEEDGNSYLIDITEEFENVPNTGAVRTTKSRWERVMIEN